MKLLNNNTKKLTSDFEDNPRAICLRNQFPTSAQLIRAYAPDRQYYCDRNLEQAIAKNAPTLALVETTYGEEATITLLYCHVANAIMNLGEESDVITSDLMSVSRAILSTERARTLALASIVAFFHRLSCGEYKIFGRLTPRKILEAFHEYLPKAIERERSAKDMAEKARLEAERNLHEKSAITFEEFKSIKGYGEEIQNPLDIIFPHK